MMEADAGSRFLERSRYYLCGEYPTKIRRCVEVLPDEAVWKRPAPGSNSIGNLLAHLEGNVRQWVVGGLGGAPDHRDRPSEFSRDKGPDARALFHSLEGTLAEAAAVLQRLTPDDLGRERTIQGRPQTVFDAIYHVVEHFGMHTGQIILLTKIFAPGEISFYEDDPRGLATPSYSVEGQRKVVSSE
jgi:uncharacterized damage-inducible protein DinB